MIAVAPIIEAFPTFDRANNAREAWLDKHPGTRVAFKDDLEARYQTDYLATIKPRDDGAYVLTIRPTEQP